MKSFEDFYKDLISNHVWAGPAMMHHKEQTFKNVANKVYVHWSAGDQVEPIEACRRHVYNKISLLPGDNVKVDWTKKALENLETKEEKEWIPLTGEERQKKLAEFKAIIDAAPIINGMPPISKKQAVEEGGWIPAKPAPWPVTTPEEAYVRDRHFEWIKTCFEPRTGEKNINYVPEEDFNIWYDCEKLNGQGK